jgi:hypothetical protein
MEGKVKKTKYKNRANRINKSNKRRSKKRRRTERRTRIAIMKKIESNDRKRISKYVADNGKT